MVGMELGSSRINLGLAENQYLTVGQNNLYMYYICGVFVWV